LSYDATFKLTKYLVYTSKDGNEFKGKLINLRLVNNYCGVEIISGLLSRAHCLGGFIRGEAGSSYVIYVGVGF